jgi:hypothetical protein
MKKIPQNLADFQTQFNVSFVINLTIYILYYYVYNVLRAAIDNIMDRAGIKLDKILPDSINELYFGINFDENLGYSNERQKISFLPNNLQKLYVKNPKYRQKYIPETVKVEYIGKPI